MNKVTTIDITTTDMIVTMVTKTNVYLEVITIEITTNTTGEMTGRAVDTKITKSPMTQIDTKIEI